MGGAYRPKQFAERHKQEGWTEGQIRWLIFTADENGLNAAGAISRVGRRIFIHEDAFYAWLRKQRTAA
ncbi:MAG: DNA-binding protein [Betaproteobacteria bacterium]|nr:DNA-binding protein [Betaproteobacteria bacterium]